MTLTSLNAEFHHALSGLVVELSKKGPNMFIGVGYYDGTISYTSPIDAVALIQAAESRLKTLARP